MSEEGTGKEVFGKVYKKSWSRKGREADLTDVPVRKLQKAAEERGVRINITELTPGKIKAQVDKVVVKGDDEK
ncbi:hypothetical protein DRO61_12680 [Candidatus Bathyarchaeota archaeon]|nr:MAG: hypothetical protein DRO61_12680 [Candidatus Bathyarchaeota archaeon]